MGRQKVPAVKAFPPDVCGSCRFFHEFQDGNVCLVHPAAIANTQDDESVWLRGAPADADEPACRFYYPKFH